MTSTRKLLRAQLFDFLSGEILLTSFAGQRNGGSVIFARSVWVSFWVFVAIEAVRGVCVVHDGLSAPGSHIALPQTLLEAASVIRKELGHISRQHGSVILAVFAGVYTALYTRFASQWQYLADLYNQIKAKEIDISLARECEQLKHDHNHAVSAQAHSQEAIACSPALLLAQWKIGFIEDAQALHLAEKPLFATVILNWRRDSVVGAVIANRKSDVMRSPTRP